MEALCYSFHGFWHHILSEYHINLTYEPSTERSKMVFNKDNKKEISAIEDLIKSKVYVNPKRYEELSKLRDDIWGRTLELTGEPCTLLCLNLSTEVESPLQSLEGYALQEEQICEDPGDPCHKVDRKRFLKLLCGKALQEGRVVAIIHELSCQNDELTLLDRRIIALSLLNKLPVVTLATRSPHVLPAASAATGDTWPVFFVPHPQEDMRPVCQWLLEELPRVRALSASIEMDLQNRVAHLARVNAPLHFLSRASVALVPFGVMTVNFLGILRLMASMLQCVGMRGDTSAKKALGLLGAKNAAFVTAIDSMGDVYSFAVFSTVLADLQGLGLVEAAAAMDVLDGLMLGSISAVTGAVSALGAYLSRPLVVRASAEFLASLQTIYVLNPAMRRESERRPRGGRGKAVRKKCAGRKGRQGDAEGDEADQIELQGLLQRCNRRAVSSGEAAARDSAAAEVLANARGAEPQGLQEEGGEAEALEGPLEKAFLGDGSSPVGSTSDEGEEVVNDGSETEKEETKSSELAALDPALRDGGGRQLACGRSAAKLSREERKQAAREAKATRAATKAAAKAAAKAEKAAAKLAERERKQEAKRQQWEKKAAEKASAKRRSKLQLDAAGMTEQAGEAYAASEGTADGREGAPKPTVAMVSTNKAAKTPWWQRRKAAAAMAEASAPEDAADTATGVSRSLSSSSASSVVGDVGGEGKGEQQLQGRMEAALGREARLGLDEVTSRALMEFLALPDEDVYVLEPLQLQPTSDGSDGVLVK
ncbi:hypothetical protein VaNZ11_002846 [Volvox africanus]|uniref:Uncharacterized protein n=1 Tax=Volvox africanus TaxID=51714 RepID=A0ABQ5RTV7_9CHLO|nr:hypothetical protein VaNZ11_002846 [Volvox africanus]